MTLPLKEQVCSLELAKKLKDLGVKQESLWWWIKYKRMPNNSIIWVINNGNIKDSNEYSFIEKIKFSTFTVAELGEMLPVFVLGDKEEDIPHMWCVQYFKEGGNTKETWQWSCQLTQGECYIHQVRADTEADVRAMMLIYLLEKGLVKL